MLETDDDLATYAELDTLHSNEPGEFKINDVKVNPASGNVYIAVTRGTGQGQPAIVKITRGGELSALSMKDVPMSKVSIPNPAAGKGATSSITSMQFVNDTAGRWWHSSTTIRP